MRRKLGLGWYEIKQDGQKPFYVNKTSKKKQWEWPEEIPDPASTAASKVEPKKKGHKLKLGKGWYEIQQPGQQAPFYVNKKLKKKQWHWPDNIPRPGSSVDDGAATSTSASRPSPVASLKDIPSPVVKPEDIPPPCDDDPDSPGSPMPPPPPDEPTHKSGLSAFAKATAKVHVNADDVDQARRMLKRGHLKNRFHNVNLRKLIDEDVDGEWDYEWKDYARTNYDLESGGSFFGTTNKVKIMAKLLQYNRKVMNRGLLKRSNRTKEGKEEAAQMSKNILSYMKDRGSTKKPIEHSLKILRIALAKASHQVPAEAAKAAKPLASLVLWDEIYCLLVKQTTMNPCAAHPNSLLAGFELLTLCAGSVQCTQTLYPYVMAHLDRAKRGLVRPPADNLKAAATAGHIRKLARRAQVRLRKTCMMKRRKKVPTCMEIAAVLAAQPVLVRVYLLDKTHTTVPVNSHTTGSTVASMVAMSLGAKDASIFDLYQVDHKSHTELVHSDTRVLDVIASWQQAADDHKDMKQIRRGDHASHFVFKVRYFLDLPESDVIGNNLLYLQALWNVHGGMYPLSRKGCLDLGALQLQEELGDWRGGVDMEILRGNLHRYVPVRFTEEPAAFESALDHLKRRWTKLQSLKMQQYDCQLTYLDLIQTSMWYGTQPYKVMPIAGGGEYPPGGVWLKVARSCIIVVDVDSNDILETISMESVMAYGSKENTLLIRVGNIIFQMKKCFRTTKREGADQITDLIRTYKKFEAAALAKSK